MKISIIAAIGKNRELGKDNKLIWHIKADLQRFKTLTSGHPIIMGRKTWDSLPFKPLPNRYNILITRDLEFKIKDLRKGKDLVIANSLEEAIQKAEEILKQVQHDTGEGEAFIIGGGQIYEQAIEKRLVDKLYLTIVDGNFDADTFFPDYSQFKKVIFEKEGSSEKYKYRFLELER